MENRKIKPKIALSTAFSAPLTAPILLIGDINENIKSAKDLGYDAIEIHLRENTLIDYDKINKISKKYDIKIASIVTGSLAVQKEVSLTDPDIKKSDIAFKGLLKYIQIAAKFNTDIIIGWIRGRIQDFNKETFEITLAEKLKEAEIIALKKGVKIFIEAINRYEINSMNKAKDILEFIDSYNLYNTYVHLDTFHMNIEETSIEKTIEVCMNKLGYIHFADSNRFFPGAGHIDFKKVINALDKINYQGYISVECLPYPDRKTAARNAINNINKYIDN